MLSPLGPDVIAKQQQMSRPQPVVDPADYLGSRTPDVRIACTAIAPEATDFPSDASLISEDAELSAS